MKRSDLNDLYDITLMSLDEAFLPDVFFGFYQQWPEGQFVATDFTGKPVGFLCSVKLVDESARIMMLAVHPAYRNKGAGQQLLDSLKVLARMSNLRYITLEVRPENVKARKFYKRNGFLETQILSAYYRDGGEGIRMDLFLS